MDEFLYNYVKPRIVDKSNLCYIDKDSFIVYTKTSDIYKEITENVKTRFDSQIVNETNCYQKEKK